MSQAPLMPSDVRKRVLVQHREIEQMISELEAGTQALRAGREDPERVKRAAYALRGVLELHMTFEETHLVPAIQETDGFGPERAKHLHAEHADQRQQLDQLVYAILDAKSAAEIDDGVKSLARMLRRDIEEEEENYVNEKLLHDDLIPTDPFGG